MPKLPSLGQTLPKIHSHLLRYRKRGDMLERKGFRPMMKEGSMHLQDSHPLPSWLLPLRRSKDRPMCPLGSFKPGMPLAAPRRHA